jgi:uncharacterized protein YhfF
MRHTTANTIDSFDRRGEAMSGPTPAIGKLVDAFWCQKASFLGLADADSPSAWAVGGSPEQADELLDLVLAGAKSATSSALWAYEAESEPLPAVGDLSVVCDATGYPKALIRTTHVSVMPFDDVPASHAYAEGGGDRSLEYWRREHEAFFRASMPAGLEFEPTMPVVLEHCEVL